MTALPPYVCTNCGFWQRYFERPPSCPVCLDFRHPLPAGGWDFRSEKEVANRHETTVREVLPDVWMTETTPALGIGPAGWLVQTEAGNVHWEGAGWVDDDALDTLERLGGVDVLAFSHSHVLGAAWRVAERFAPRVVVQSEQLPFAQALPVTAPFGARADVLPGVALVHTGGHTPGHSILHWAPRRLVFCGDAFKFTLDAESRATHISTHTAFDAHIPLSHDHAARYHNLFFGLDFDGIVTPWEAVPSGGKAAALALLDAQLAGPPSADPFPIPGGPLPAASAQNANRPA